MGDPPIITRKWAMPNKNTFSIKPIFELVWRYIKGLEPGDVVDPFVGENPFKSFCICNDLNEDIFATEHMESLEFLRRLPTDSFKLAFFDPPYSSRQIAECYKGVGREVTMFDTQASFYTDRRKELARVLVEGGFSITCGWNSNGIGKVNGFEIVEILLVAHGAAHNDTIITVERKVGG